MEENLWKCCNFAVATPPPIEDERRERRSAAGPKETENGLRRLEMGPKEFFEGFRRMEIGEINIIHRRSCGDDSKRILLEQICRRNRVISHDES